MWNPIFVIIYIIAYSISSSMITFNDPAHLILLHCTTTIKSEIEKMHMKQCIDIQLRSSEIQSLKCLWRFLSSIFIGRVVNKHLNGVWIHIYALNLRQLHKKNLWQQFYTFSLIFPSIVFSYLFLLLCFPIYF